MPYVEKLARLKRERGLTNDALAALSRVPVGTVNKIRAGQTRRPAFQTLLRLCRALRAPLCYLLDTNIPPEYDLCAYAHEAGCFSLSEEEFAMLQLCRLLPSQDRLSVTRLLESLSAPVQRPGAPVRRLICYTQPDRERAAPFLGRTRFRLLEIPLDETAKLADFAVQINTGSLKPFYASGDVLLVSRTQARHGQMGLFLYNQKLMIREYYYRRGVRKLVSPTLGLRDTVLRDTDKFLCLGVPLQAARNYRWI